MGFKEAYDVETVSPVGTDRGSGEKHVYADDPAVPAETFTYGDSTYAKIQRFAGRFNIEQRGIERVPEDERTDTSLVNVGTMVRNGHSTHSDESLWR